MGQGVQWGSLLQGFGVTLEKKMDQDHEDKKDKRRSLEKILGQVDPTTLDDRGREEYGRMIDETYGDIVGKGKGGGKGAEKKTPWSMIQRVVHAVHPGNQGGQGGQPMDEKIPGVGGTSAMPSSVPRVPTQGGANSQQDPKANMGSPSAIPAGAPPVPQPPQGGGSLGDMLAHHTLDPWKQQFDHYTQMEDYRHKHQLEEIEARNKKGGAYTVKSTTTGDQLPEGSTDIEGNAIDPKKHYKIAMNQAGEQQYLPTEGPKMSAAMEKRQQKVKDRMTAMGEDEETATKRVAIQEFKDGQEKSIQDALRTSGMRLSQQESRLRMQKIQEQIQDGNLTFKNAKTLMDWAKSTARAKKADKGAPMEVISADIDTLIDKELQNLGTSRGEILDAMRNKGGAVAPEKPAAAKPKSSGGRPEVTISADGAITVK